MKTSVLSVTYDCESACGLDSCLASLAAQTRPADEVVLVLDGEIRSELREIIDRWERRLPLKVIPASKQGLPGCLNIGLARCTGEIVFRVDTDDVSLPERFAEQARILEEHPVSVTSAPVIEVWENSLEMLKSVPSGVTRRWNLYSFFRNPVNHNCCAYRKSDVLAAGGYPETPLLPAEDYCLWINILVRGKRIFGSRRPLLKADVRRLLKRSIRCNLFLTELRLMRLNAPRLAYCGCVLAIIAFVTRVSLGLFSAKSRKMVYRYFLRQRFMTG